MDIDAMTPKQLGSAVAQEVLGWTEVDRYVLMRDYEGPYPAFAVHESYDWLYVVEGKVKPELPRRWRGWKNKEDMWEVIEKLGETYRVKIHTGDIPIVLPKYRGKTDVEVWNGYLNPVARVRADTVCVAVLRAALTAVRQNQHLTSV